MSMFSQSEWESLQNVARAPGPAAVSMNGNGDMEAEYGGPRAPESRNVEAEIDTLTLVTFLLAAGLACIAAAMLIHLKRVR